MINLGDRAAGTTLSFDFNTHQADGTPITLAGTPAISVYKNSTTESTSGVTLTVDYDSRTGMHHVVIDTSSDGTFYATGNDFSAVITTGTVNSISVVGMVVAKFSLGRANISHLAGTALTGRDIGASVLLSSGTGTGQLDFTSGIVKSNMNQILGTAVSTPATAGILDVNVKNMNNVAATSITAINANIGQTQPINFTGTGASAYVKADSVNIGGAVPASATIGTVTTVTNQLTAAAIATGVWQDATAGDFTTASSIGKALYISNVAPGGSGGHLISGSNSGTTTLGALTVTGATTLTGVLTATNASNDVNGCNIQKINSQSVTASGGITVNSNVGTTQPINFTGTGASALAKTDIHDILGTAISTPATAGILDVNIKNMNNVAATSITTINANQGTTQPINFTGTGSSALAKSDMVDIAGAPVSTSTAQIGVNAVQHGGTVQTGRDIGASVLLSSGTGTGQILLSSGQVTVGTNNDKTGYALASTAVNVTAVDGVALSTHASGMIPSDVRDISGSAVSSSTAQIGVNVVNMGGVVQTGRDIGASVLLSSGTGTGQLDFTSGVVKSNLINIKGSDCQGGSAYLELDHLYLNSAAAVSFKAAGVDITSAPESTGFRGAMKIRSTVDQSEAALSITSPYADGTAMYVSCIYGKAMYVESYTDEAINVSSGKSGGYAVNIHNNTNGGGVLIDATQSNALQALALVSSSEHAVTISTNGTNKAAIQLSNTGGPDIISNVLSATVFENSVWDAVSSTHATDATTGKALINAGSAGDPWGTALPGSYGDGTAGKIMGTNLDAKISDVKTQTDKMTFTVTNQIDANVLDWKSSTAPAMTGDAYAIVSSSTYGNSALHNEVAKDSTVMKSSSYTAPDNTNIVNIHDIVKSGGTGDNAAIKTQTDKMQFDGSNNIKSVKNATTAGTADFNATEKASIAAASSSAGDPWTTTLPGAYTSSQAGGILGQLTLHNIEDQVLDAALIGHHDYTGSLGGYVVTIDGKVATIESQTAPETIENTVWDAMSSSHATDATTGKALSNASSAGDPWDTALPGAYGDGTAGKILANTLNSTSTANANLTQIEGVDLSSNQAILSLKKLIVFNADGDAVTFLAGSSGNAYTLGVTGSGEEISSNFMSDIKSQVDKMTFSSGGNIDANTLMISNSSAAASLLNYSANTMRSATVDTTNFTPTTTKFESDLADVLDAHWKDRWVIFITGSLTGSAKPITDYSLVAGKGRITCTAFPIAPSNGDRFIIV